MWHARLYFMRPVCRLVLATLWLVSAILGFMAGADAYLLVFAKLGIGESQAAAVTLFMSVVDLAIGTALLAGWRHKQLAAVQLAVVAGYTLGLTFLMPSLWGDLFGSLLKNGAVIALILVHRVLEEER